MGLAQWKSEQDEELDSVERLPVSGLELTRDLGVYRRVLEAARDVDSWVREAIALPLALYASAPRRCIPIADAGARWGTPKDCLRALYAELVGFRQRPEMVGARPEPGSRTPHFDPHVEAALRELRWLAAEEGARRVLWLLWADVELWPPHQRTKRVCCSLVPVGVPEPSRSASGWAYAETPPPQSKVPTDTVKALGRLAWGVLVAERDGDPTLDPETVVDDVRRLRRAWARRVRTVYLEGESKPWLVSAQ